MIEKIEELGNEIQPAGTAEWQVFEHSQIQCYVPWHLHGVSAETHGTTGQRKRSRAVPVEPSCGILRSAAANSKNWSHFYMAKYMIDYCAVLSLPPVLFITDREIPKSIKNEPLLLMLAR